MDYWKFNEGEGNKADSALDGGTDGGLFSRPAGSGQWVRGKFGMAVRQTSGQSITFRDYTDPVGPDGKIHQMSIAFWAKTPGGHGEYRIGKGKGRPMDVNGGNWFLSRHANTEGWDVRSFDGGLASMTGMVDGPDAKPATFGAFARDGFGGDGVQWHHQVVVYDGDNKQVRFYTDGRARRDGADDRHQAQPQRQAGAGEHRGRAAAAERRAADDRRRRDGRSELRFPGRRRAGDLVASADRRGNRQALQRRGGGRDHPRRPDERQVAGRASAGHGTGHRPGRPLPCGAGGGRPGRGGRDAAGGGDES